MPAHALVRALLSAGLLAAVAVLPACDAPPRGERSGRGGVAETTAAEVESRRILPVALIESSDEVAQQLIQDLQTDVPRIRDAEAPVTVVLGDVNNRTGIVRSSDFDVARRRLRNSLINSPIGRDKLTFVERRARMSDLARRERVASDGQLADPPDYDPQTTYALNGDFLRVDRGDTNLYYMEFQLVHFGSNEIVFTHRYEIKQNTP